MSEELIEELIDISKEKLSLLNLMLKFTKEQKNFIKEDNIEKVNLIINKKDNLIEKIDSLDIQFLSKFIHLKKENNVEDINELNIEDFPKLKDLKEIIEEISSTLMALSLLDEENKTKLKMDLENVKSNLKNIKKGKKVYNSYNKTLNNSILIDEKK